MILVLVCSCTLQGLFVVKGQNVSDANTTVAQTATDICNQQPDPGYCYAYIPQYFYNATSNKCETFIYGGCPGNENRFRSKEKCMETCNPESIVSTRSGGRFVKPIKFEPNVVETCNQEPDSGPCLAYIPQFFYNTTSGKCETFIYGGCGGNLNRFDSLTTCQMYCRAFPEVNSTEVCNQPPETGPCKAYVPQLYYNAESQMCMPFIYGGCDGNYNRFESLQMCLKTCHPEGSDVIQEDAAFKSTDLCHLPMDAGLCDAYMPRYFYNSTSHRCERFIYGGCQGNKNNFGSMRSCILNCHEGRDKATPFKAFTSKSTDICSLPPETGPCKAAFPRYYYDPASNGCHLFIYGGCDGNQNNFVNEEACLKHCKNDKQGL